MKQSGVEVSICRSCSADIIWATSTKTGKAIPLDAAPVDDGNLTLDGDQATPYVATASTEMFAPPLYVSHFATCPQAGQWRRKDRR